MKALGLYPKTLLSFLVLLVMVQVLMFGSFLLFEHRPPPDGPDPRVRALALLARKTAQTAIDGAGATSEVLQAQARELAGLLQAPVWFQAQGKPLAQSAPQEIATALLAAAQEPLPAGQPFGEWRLDTSPEGQVVPTRIPGPPPGPPPGQSFLGGPLGPPPGPPHGGAPGPPPGPPPAGPGLLGRPPEPPHMLLVIPLETAAPPQVRLCVLLRHPPGPPPPHHRFLERLALICLLVALLVIPVSRLIASPIRRLRQSALRIADGDLNHRAQVSTNDEIGELAQAFNHMTDRLQQMILASRELLAYVSHELRSPLARLNVAGQLLGDGLASQSGGQALRYLDDMREEVTRMDDLLGRILLLSRLDLQQAPLRQQEVDLSSLLEGLVEKWRPWLDSRELRLRLDLAPRARVWGDPEALASALSNLLDNAAKHSLAGGEVWLKLWREGGQWRLAVGNPAPPLGAVELEAIFLPFYRAASASAEGSGLGLALSKRILEAHGGRIAARYQGPELIIEASLPALDEGAPAGAA